jgi:hypothetical protein
MDDGIVKQLDISPSPGLLINLYNVRHYRVLLKVAKKFYEVAKKTKLSSSGIAIIDRSPHLS